MQTLQSPILVHNSPPISIMQILRMLNPPNQVHGSLQYKNINISQTFNQVNFSNSIYSQVQTQIQQENNAESNKRKRSDIYETVAYKYYLKHGIKPTKRKYHVGFQRLQKKIKNQGNKYVSKRKTTVKIDDYIVELASSGRLALAISVEVKKKFNKIISRQAIIRRLIENHFKYRKSFKVPELNESQIMLRYNFAKLLFKNDFNFKKEMIIFSDEARFSFRLDNHKWWVKEDDMSENAITQIRKYHYSTLILADIRHK